MHRFDQAGLDDAGRLGKADQPVYRLGDLGRTARAMAHLAGDEARVQRTGTDHPRQRGAKRARARPVRVGRVEHDEIGRAAEGLDRSGKTADVSHVGRPLQQVAAQIVLRMKEQVCGRNPVGKGAVLDLAKSLGPAKGIAARREIGRAKLRAARPRAACQQFLGPGAIGSRRGAEDAPRPAPGCDQRILVGRLLARGYGCDCRVKKRDLRAEHVAKEARDAPGDVDPGTADNGKRKDLDCRHPRRRGFPDRAAAEERETLRDRFSTAAQACASPEVEHD